jgi:hypothetical protein
VAPALECDHSPYGFDKPEWPCALEETISRTKQAGDGEGQDEPVTPILKRVADWHHRHGEQAASSQR